MCSRCESVIKAIDRYIAKADDELAEMLETEGRAAPRESVKMVSEMEKGVADALTAQTSYYIKQIKQQSSVSDLVKVFEEIKAKDVYCDEIAAVASSELKKYVPKMVVEYAAGMDSGIKITEVSKRTTDWIDSWSGELSNLMKLNSQTQIETIIKDALKNGDSIQTVTRTILDSGIRDEYYKARRVAMTEMFRAQNVSKYEAALQTPSVKGKRWRHTGIGKPRENHVDMDGQEVDKEKPFTMYGRDGGVYYPQYPIDPLLPAGESINCHCVMENIVDPNILGLTQDERQQLRDEAVAKLDEDWEREVDAKYRAAGKAIPKIGLTTGVKRGKINSVTIEDVKALATAGGIAKACIDEIAKALGDDAKYFDKVKIIKSKSNADGTIDLLRTNVKQNGTWADVTLEINEEVFRGRTLEEVNERILNSHKVGRSVIKNLQEAVWHEAGHAKLAYGKSYARIEADTEILNDYHIDGISKTAYINGDECLAECNVLKRRGEKIPKQAKELWDKFMEERG